jgi:hypothetical protein
VSDASSLSDVVAAIWTRFHASFTSPGALAVASHAVIIRIALWVLSFLPFDVSLLFLRLDGGEPPPSWAAPGLGIVGSKSSDLSRIHTVYYQVLIVLAKVGVLKFLYLSAILLDSINLIRIIRLFNRSYGRDIVT